jgi:hypothetical protein
VKEIRRYKRGPMTGRHEGGETYAQIEEQVLTSEALRSLPHFAVRALLAHAAQFRGDNNGSLAVTATQAPKYGLRKWELYAGQQLLELCGIMRRTRQGKLANGIRLPTWFAITWRKINKPPPHQHYDGGTRPTAAAPSDYILWQKPDDWDEVVKKFLRKHRGKTGCERLKEKKARESVTRQAGNGPTRRAGDWDNAQATENSGFPYLPVRQPLRIWLVPGASMQPQRSRRAAA